MIRKKRAKSLTKRTSLISTWRMELRLRLLGRLARQPAVAVLAGLEVRTATVVVVAVAVLGRVAVVAVDLVAAIS